MAEVSYRKAELDDAADIHALLLTLAVPLHRAGMSPAVAFPIIRVLLTPLVRALQARLAVDGVGGDLLAVIISASAALAAGVAAHRLPRLIFRWLEDPLTEAATPFAHTGGCRIPQRGTVRWEI